MACVTEQGQAHHSERCAADRRVVVADHSYGQPPPQHRARLAAELAYLIIHGATYMKLVRTFMGVRGEFISWITVVSAADVLQWQGILAQRHVAARSYLVAEGPMCKQLSGRG